MNCFCMCFLNDRKKSFHYLSNKAQTKSNIYTELPVVINPLKNPRYYKTICNHQASTYDELSFMAGDILEVECFKCETMWRAKHINTSFIKYVDRDMLESDPIYEMNKWFFKDVNRLEAEQLLLSLGNVKGSFLVRNSQGGQNPFVLSVRCEDHNFHALVKHYRIQKGNLGYYITNGLNFDALETLIDTYKQDVYGMMGLYQALKVPCLTGTIIESSL